MTIVGDVDREKVQRIIRFAPHVDILGVNSYGGAETLGRRLKEYGWTKPFILTEFGPKGWWETPKTSWGAPIEQSSTEKAEWYRSVYEKTILANPGWCLGSYAFFWGSKEEGTPTWFGLQLPSGERLGALDVLSEMWTGKPVAEGAPRIESMSFDAAEKVVAPGSALHASVKVIGGAMVKWRLCPTEGSATLDAADGQAVEFQAPWEPGNYRLYVYVFDGKNHAAVANEPFRVAR
jgi:hypothetical protein